MAVLLCAAALGIIAVHGLGSGPAPDGHAGHHATPGIVMTVDSTEGGTVPYDDAIRGEAPPTDDAGLLALCLMMLAPGLTMGLWWAARAARERAWRLPPRMARVVTVIDEAALPPPFARRLSVLRI